jgi:hypothetical protein
MEPKKHKQRVAMVCLAGVLAILDDTVFLDVWKKVVSKLKVRARQSSSSARHMCSRAPSSPLL